MLLIARLMRRDGFLHQKHEYIVLAPVGIGLFDYLENICLVVTKAMWSRGYDIEIVTGVAASMTGLKWACVGLVACVIVTALVFRIAARLFPAWEKRLIWGPQIESDD